MHEFSFAQQILEAVQRQAADYPGCKVGRIRLRAGKFLALDRASLSFCLEAISSDTPVEGAAIELIEIGPELTCTQCGVVPMKDVWEKACPQCGREGRLAPAMDLVIEAIEIYDEGEAPDGQEEG